MSLYIPCSPTVMLSRGQSATRTNMILQDNNPPIDALDREGGILVVTLSGVELHSASILIDRKPHEGMIGFVERLDRPFSCLMPRLTSAEAGHAMDMIEVPKSEMPYRVNALEKPLLSAESLRIIESSLTEYAGLPGCLKSQSSRGQCVWREGYPLCRRVGIYAANRT